MFTTERRFHFTSLSCVTSVLHGMDSQWLQSNENLNQNKYLQYFNLINTHLYFFLAHHWFAQKTSWCQEFSIKSSGSIYFPNGPMDRKSAVAATHVNHVCSGNLNILPCRQISVRSVLHRYIKIEMQLYHTWPHPTNTDLIWQHVKMKVFHCVKFQCPKHQSKGSQCQHFNRVHINIA